MKQLKHKDIMYAVMRRSMDKRDFPATGTDVVCCFTKTLERAEELSSQYEQAFLDSGGDKEDTYFYVVGNVFYNE